MHILRYITEQDLILLNETDRDHISLSAVLTTAFFDRKKNNTVRKERMSMRNCTMQRWIHLGISFLTPLSPFVSPMEHRRILQGNRPKTQPTVIEICDLFLDVYVTFIIMEVIYQLPRVWKVRSKPSYCRQYGF